MIRPSKDAERFRLVLDPMCPRDVVYFQRNTWFMHPNTFLDGRDWKSLVKQTQKAEVLAHGRN